MTDLQQRPWDSPANPGILENLPLFQGQPAPATEAAGAPHLLNVAQGGPAVGPDEGATVDPNAMDWERVRAFREQVAKAMSEEIQAIGGFTEEHEILGRKLINQTLSEFQDGLVRAGTPRWTEDHTEKVYQAVFDSLFGLGRLQPLVDREGVENVMIFGCDDVWLEYRGGRLERGPAVADSDEELIEQIQFLATRNGEGSRNFSVAAWQLALTLPGGERLQATHPPITPRPTIVIRSHPLISTTLQDLVDYETITPAAVEFLVAAVRARKSFVVSGMPGAGKTTLLRALAHAMDPHEHVLTIEQERELHLGQSGLHHLVTAFEAREGQGELGPDGRKTGEVTVDDLLVASLRHNTQRLIVGEVRGPEVAAMIQAMQAGAGSMSTVHTESPAEAVERLAVLLTTSKMNASADFAYRLVSAHIDFIVQIDKKGNTRFISEIAELVSGETERPLAMPIFKAPRGSTRAEIVGTPQDKTLDDMVDQGFDAERHQMRGGFR